MGRKWMTTAIGSQVTLQRGFDITKAEQCPGQIPVVSSGGIGSFHDTAMVKAPGVVLGRKGTLGSVYYLDVDYWPHDTTLWVKDFHGNCPRFVFYFFRNMSEELLSMDAGAANPALNRNHLHPVEVLWPPKDEQERIASMLGSLDDKIEVKRRMNETLEGMARALFQAWFVDFEPVRAKQRGQKPEGMDAATAALFPSSFENSSLGPIPKGWRTGKLGDVAANIRRGANPDEIDGNTPYIGLEHMPRCSIALCEWGEAAKVSSNKSCFTKGDVLFGKLRPYFHKVGVAPCDGVCSTDILVLQPCRPEWGGFVLMIVSDTTFVNYTEAGSGGTKMPRTSWEQMAAYDVALPSEKLAASFNALFEPLIVRILRNIHESRTLAELRDTLLPKLLSGEMRVKDFAKAI